MTNHNKNIIAAIIAIALLILAEFSYVSAEHVGGSKDKKGDWSVGAGIQAATNVNGKYGLRSKLTVSGFQPPTSDWYLEILVSLKTSAGTKIQAGLVQFAGDSQVWAKWNVFYSDGRVEGGLGSQLTGHTAYTVQIYRCAGVWRLYVAGSLVKSVTESSTIALSPEPSVHGVFTFTNSLNRNHFDGSAHGHPAATLSAKVTTSRAIEVATTLPSTCPGSPSWQRVDRAFVECGSPPTWFDEVALISAGTSIQMSYFDGDDPAARNCNQSLWIDA